MDFLEIIMLGIGMNVVVSPKLIRYLLNEEEHPEGFLKKENGRLIST